MFVAPSVPLPVPAFSGELSATPAVPVGRQPLAALVDLALRSNPQTRTAWLEARIAAAAVVQAQGARWPQLDAELPIAVQRQSMLGGRFLVEQASLAPAVTLSWLALDFGGRSAAVEQARAALAQANLVHNGAVQDVVFVVEQSYFATLGARALASAQAVAVDEVQRALDAAEERRRAGVATVADVLQAKTALAQAQFSLQTTRGEAARRQGALAAAAGLRADTAIELDELPVEVDVSAASRTAGEALDQAARRRPDLARARQEVQRAQAAVRVARSARLPSLVLSGTVGENFYPKSDGVSFGENLAAGASIRVPLFRGGALAAALEAARDREEAARAQLASAELLASLRVWDAWQGLRTASQQMETARALVQSAQQSAEAAEGRYRSGLGSVLDLLTAQAALAGARAQEVQARASWFQSLAVLAHETGALGPEPEGER